MKKAIITGGTGYIGSNLCRRLLKENWEVYVIAQKNYSNENIEDIKNRIKIYEYDGNIQELINYMKPIKADIVFHLASAIITEHKIEDLHKILGANLIFGTEILEAMKQSNTKLLINTGTYWQNYNNENYNPVDLYAATKEAFQKIIKYYVEAENFRCITLKLFDTYGENDKRLKLINLLKKAAEDKITLNMSPGEQLLDLVYIDDVIEGYLVAYDNLINNIDLKDEEFAICTEELLSLKEIVKLFEGILGKNIDINWGGRNYRKREVMIPWKNYKKLPNWNFKISLKEGLKKYV